MSDRPLLGRTVVTTRDRPGRLDALLAGRGATVVHVPLIEIVDVDGGASGLAAELDRLGAGDWLVVTSQHGAERVTRAGRALVGVRTAAVGSRTADVLAAAIGRPVDLVPERQTGAELVAMMPEPVGPGARLLVAQADRASDEVATGMARLGYDVVAVTAYRTSLRAPTAAERAAALGADVLALASGSAAQSWVAAFGTSAPPIVAAIGPTTGAVAADAGLAVTHVAPEHTVEGLAATIECACAERSNQ